MYLQAYQKGTLCYKKQSYICLLLFYVICYVNKQTLKLDIYSRQRTISFSQRECNHYWKLNMGAFHSTKNSGNSGLGSEWNSHFPELHSEILGVPREVGLKFRKIGIPGKFRSIWPFLLGPSVPEPGNRIQHG